MVTIDHTCERYDANQIELRGDSEAIREYLRRVPAQCTALRRQLEREIASLEGVDADARPATLPDTSRRGDVPQSTDGKRLALVIGNANYRVPAWRLRNAVSDAVLIRRQLEKLGFEVIFFANADRIAMERAFRTFGQRLQAIGPTAVSFVYYAGHGAEGDGVNYLLPVDADVRTIDQLRFAAPPMQFLLDDMAAARNAINIVVLDACRDMPLPSGQRTVRRGGLAPIQFTPNVLISYSTAPGQTAEDGPGQNSTFTLNLAAALEQQSSEPIELLFADVQSRVQSETSGAQRPRYVSGLSVSRWTFTGKTTNAQP